MENIDIKFMKAAIKEAKKAAQLDEVPVGAIIVYNNRIICRAHNLRESKKNALAHAEIIAINKACKKLDAWRLINSTMYVTCEPCPMCAGAILNSRISKVVYGASDPKMGALGSSFNLFDQKGMNHHPEIIKGILEDQCSLLLKEFFKNKRNKID